MTELLFGWLAQLPIIITVASVLLMVVVLGYTGATLWVWTVVTVLMLWGLGAPLWLWPVIGIVALVFNLTPVRRQLITKPIMAITDRLGLLPTISETERIALEAGNNWIEGEFISGKPDFELIIKREAYPELREDENKFLQGPVEELCRLVDDWDVHQKKDLSEEAWEYIKDKRFLGLVIPKAYGGHGFSANGMNAVIAKVGSRSVPMAVDVMVPNSLGPAELLINYGTQDQKEHYLPRLARGDEIPCFALTEPDAGTDAAAINSTGEVFQGEEGELYLRLNWQKRYITLAAVATVLGLAFRLKDPENLLGKGKDQGITVGLIPTDAEGVVLGRRHNPLHTPFINSPTEGHNVVVSINQIIGGPEQAGNGWKMLMETLAAGRGIFIPALNTGGAKLAARVAGDYAVVRQQFGLPIGRFEGVEELLAPIGGLTYLMDALSRFTCGGVDSGNKPAVISTIAKYHSSEFNRTIINNAMDLLGGKGIALGPNNLLGNGYVAAPIAITVEGSNVVSRSLIIFGQGLVRCHPFVLEELRALENNDLTSFDRAVWGHFRMLVRNFFRAAVLSLTRGYLAASPVKGTMAQYYRKLSWASAAFALTADIALFSLGGRLKMKERLSGRFADILSWLYLGTCALRRYEAEGRKENDRHFLQWSLDYALWQIQAAFAGILDNFPVPVLGWLFKHPIAFWSRLNPIGRKPGDELGSQVAVLLQTPGEARDALTRGIYLPEGYDEPLSKLERAFKLAHECRNLYARIREAVRSGKLEKARPKRLADGAFEAGVVDEEEYELLKAAERARIEAISVDSFDLETLPVNLSPVSERREAVR